MGLNHNLKAALEPICATDDSKQRLHAFVQHKVLQRQRKRPMSYALACCAMLIILVCSFGGYRLYQTPVSYISVDVNPSVELALNRFDRVVQTTAYNDEGAQILQNLSLNHKRYTEAVELLLSDKAFLGYLSQDALLYFTVLSDKEEALVAGIQQCRGYAQIDAQCHGASPQFVEDAHHNGLSFGKYQAFLELSQYDSSITVEDCKNLTMRQIHDLISNHQSDKTLPDSDPQSNGHHDGSGGHGYHGGRGGKAE